MAVVSIMTTPVLLEYISLLKNIRGVLMVARKPKDAAIKWLKRYIRWRPIGAVEGVVSLLRKHGFGSKLLKELVSPFESIDKFVGIIEEQNIDRLTAETIVASSIYIAPIVILDDEAARELQNRGLITHEIKTSKSLSERDIKLHMRIAEYSMKDYHFEVIEKTGELIVSGDIKGLISYRREICEKDAKRYWRICQKKGETIIMYIDVLKVLEDNIEEIKSLLNENPNTLFALGIPVAIKIPF